MKVTRNTSEQLVLDYVPWIWAIGIFLFTMVFVVIGLGLTISGELWGILFFLFGGGIGVACLIVFVERLQLVLNRETNKLRIRRRTLLGYKEEVFPLDSLKRAIVETSHSSEGGTTSRPALVLDQNGVVMPHPVTQVYTSGNGATKTARAVNEWLGFDQQTDGVETY